MNPLDYWKICEKISVFEAILITLNVSSVEDYKSIENSISIVPRPEGYDALKRALSNALLNKEVEGEIIPTVDFDYRTGLYAYQPDTVDVRKSTVSVPSLQAWLASKGFKGGVFAPDKPSAPAYLDPNHPRYAPKLAAAVKAWEAMEDASLYAGRSPKQALETWLRRHAAEYKLASSDGRPIQTGIEEAAKVANWQPSGGAPKTPGS